MKKYILVVLFMMAAKSTFAQIPFEVMVGNKQTLYFAYIQKDLDSLGRWNIFSQGLYAVNYNDTSLNSISIDNQLTYQLNNWFGISAGGSFDGLQFNPSLGVSISYLNKKGDFSLSAFPMVQLTKPMALDFFALISYSPLFTKKWGFFLQLIAGTNLGFKKRISKSAKRNYEYFYTPQYQ
jgi:hypothetical protein